jgi:hypothetical protein
MLRPPLLRASMKPTVLPPDQEHDEHNQERNQELDMQGHNDIQEHTNRIQPDPRAHSGR